VNAWGAHIEREHVGLLQIAIQLLLRLVASLLLVESGRSWIACAPRPRPEQFRGYLYNAVFLLVALA
jgi:hypothetical protein